MHTYLHVHASERAEFNLEPNQGSSPERSPEPNRPEPLVYTEITFVKTKVRTEHRGRGRHSGMDLLSGQLDGNIFVRQRSQPGCGDSFTYTEQLLPSS